MTTLTINGNVAGNAEITNGRGDLIINGDVAGNAVISGGSGSLKITGSVGKTATPSTHGTSGSTTTGHITLRGGSGDLTVDGDVFADAICSKGSGHLFAARIHGTLSLGQQFPEGGSASADSVEQLTLDTDVPASGEKWGTQVGWERPRSKMTIGEVKTDTLLARCICMIAETCDRIGGKPFDDPPTYRECEQRMPWLRLNRTGRGGSGKRRNIFCIILGVAVVACFVVVMLLYLLYRLRRHCVNKEDLECSTPREVRQS